MSAAETILSPEDAARRSVGFGPASGSASFGGSICLNADCMDVMAKHADGYFDLAICDPPYGVNAGATRKYCSKNAKTYKPKPWDGKTPGREYFDELRRVSKRQIIWGGELLREQAARLAWLDILG